MSNDDDALDEQDTLFDVLDVEEPEEAELTFEQIVSSQAKEVFDAWYENWYVGRYTQNVGHIIKTFKAGLEAGVTPDDLFYAANILGRDAKQITEFSLQWALSQVFKEKARNLQAVDITDREENKTYGEGFE